MTRNRVAITNPAVVKMYKLPPQVGGSVKFDCSPAGGGIAGVIALGVAILVGFLVFFLKTTAQVLLAARDR